MQVPNISGKAILELLFRINTEMGIMDKSDLLARFRRRKLIKKNNNSDVIYKCEYLPVDTKDMVQVLLSRTTCPYLTV
jgi:hypothetical protein